MLIRKFFRFPVTTCFTFLILGISQVSLAQWSLNEENSALYYITSKAAAVSELNSFSALSGSIDSQGNVNISIGLASVDTAVDIRNERMREIVFQVANYPVASINVATDNQKLQQMDVGQNFMASYMAQVDLHGMQQEIAVEVNVTKLQGNGLLVVLAKPLIINASTFGLAEGVEQLRELAGLPSINNNIVVDFSLQFDTTD